MGLKTAPSKAAGDQRGSPGRPGPSLIYFSINKRCICWGVAWERAAAARPLCSAAICPLAGWGGGGGEPAPSFLLPQLCNKTACLSECLFLINRLSLILVPYSPDTSHTYGFTQTEALVVFLPLRREGHVCVRVCVLPKHVRYVHQRTNGGKFYWVSIHLQTSNVGWGGSLTGDEVIQS